MNFYFVLLQLHSFVKEECVIMTSNMPSAQISVCMGVCVCVHVCMYACMYVCLCVCVCGGGGM